MKKWRQQAKWKLHFWKLFLFHLKIETKTNWTRNATHQITTSLHQEWGKKLFYLLWQKWLQIKSQIKASTGEFLFFFANSYDSQLLNCSKSELHAFFWKNNWKKL